MPAWQEWAAPAAIRSTYGALQRTAEGLLAYDETPLLHPTQLMRESAAIPQDLAAELAGAQHAVGRGRQGDEDGVVRPGQTTVTIDLLLENAQQLLVEAQPAAPEVGFAFVEPSRFCHREQANDFC